MPNDIGDGAPIDVTGLSIVLPGDGAVASTADDASAPDDQVCTFRVLDDRLHEFTTVPITVPRELGLLTTAFILAWDTQRAHPQVDCDGWHIEITSSSGAPLTSLSFREARRWVV